MKSKISEDERKAWKIKSIRGKIETKKVELDRYVKTIVRYCFTEACTSGAYFNELYNRNLRRGDDLIGESRIKGKKLKELRELNLPLFALKKDEYENLKEELKWHKGLVDWAKAMMNTKLNDEKKEKIIRDCINQKAMWSDQFNRLCQIERLVKEHKEKKK